MVETSVAIAGPVIENSSVLGPAEQVAPHRFTKREERPVFKMQCVVFKSNN